MKNLLALSLAFLFFGCENNPYPETGEMRKNPRRSNREVRDALGMIVEKEYEYNEGNTTSFKLKIHVPGNAKADFVEAFVNDKNDFTIVVANYVEEVDTNDILIMKDKDMFKQRHMCLYAQIAKKKRYD